MALQFNAGESGLSLMNISKGAMDIMSTDGASPTAVKFLDAFGARFPVSLEILNEVRTIGTKYQQTVLGALKVAVGYRRGDLTTVLCESTAGLSSIAFIVVASDMFESDEVLKVMMSMAQGNVPSDMVIPSPRELNLCINVLKLRLDEFTFHQHYVRLLIAIRRQRTGEDKRYKDSLNSASSSKQFTTVLQHILSSSQDNVSKLQVWGDSGMGFLCAAASWWFEKSTEVISEGFVIWPCEDEEPKITMRVTKGRQDFGWRLERRVDSLNTLLPNTQDSTTETGQVIPRVNTRPYLSNLRCRVLRFIPEALGTLGIPEDGDLDRACVLFATLASRLAHNLMVPSTGYAVTSKSIPFMDYLGGPFNARLNQTLSLTCGTPPVDSLRTNTQLADELEDLLVRKNTLGLIKIRAPGEDHGSDVFHGLTNRGNRICMEYCLHCFMVLMILKVIALSLVTSTTSTEDYQISIADSSKLDRDDKELLEVVETFLHGEKPSIKPHPQLLGLLANSLKIDFNHNGIGSAANGLCIFLSSAIQPDMEQSWLIGVSILRGAFVYKDKYFNDLLLASETDRDTQEIDFARVGINQVLRQEGHGVLQKVEYALSEECENKLSIAVTVEDKFHTKRLVNLSLAVSKATGLLRVGQCKHPRKAALDTEYLASVVVGTVSQKHADAKSTVILPVAHSDESALYCCDYEDDRLIVILNDGCINCGIKEARSLSKSNLATVIAALTD